jgi:hypothetical protein
MFHQKLRNDLTRILCTSSIISLIINMNYIMNPICILQGIIIQFFESIMVIWNVLIFIHIYFVLVNGEKPNNVKIK